MRTKGNPQEEAKATLAQAESEVVRLQSIITSLRSEAEAKTKEVREAQHDFTLSLSQSRLGFFLGIAFGAHCVELFHDKSQFVAFGVAFALRRFEILANAGQLFRQVADMGIALGV
jgi:hypothetical protein